MSRLMALTNLVGLVAFWFVVIVFTNGLFSAFQHTIQVHERIELWRMSAKEGTHLGLAHKEYPLLGEKTLVTRVVGIASIPEGFLVKSQNGEVFVVTKAADVREVSDSESETRFASVKLTKPGTLRGWAALKNLWWLFAIEASLALLTCYIFVRKMTGSKRQQPPPLPQ